jgi:hypothetical protein
VTAALDLCPCGHVAAIHGHDGCVAATGCDCTTPATCRRCGDTTPAGCEDWGCHEGWGPA